MHTYIRSIGFSKKDSQVDIEALKALLDNTVAAIMMTKRSRVKVCLQ